MPFFLFRDLRTRTEWSARVDATHVTIGCSATATITVPDPLLAAAELAVVRRKDSYFLRDLAGHRNVILNGRTVDESILRTGDRVRAANTCFVFCAENEPGEATGAKLETLLGSEVFAPDRVLETIDAADRLGGPRPWPWIAVALCGLAAGVLLAVLGAALGRLASH